MAVFALEAVVLVPQALDLIGLLAHGGGKLLDQIEQPKKPFTVAIIGSVTKRNVCQPSAPRSMEASMSEDCVRRRRASTLL